MKYATPVAVPGKSTAYASACIAAPGQIAFISGQVSVRDGAVAHPGDPAGQCKLALANVAEVLAALKADWSNVVMVRAYVTSAECMGAFGTAYGQVVKGAAPASTAVVVQALYRPELLVEVEAVVALGS